MATPGDNTPVVDGGDPETGCESILAVGGWAALFKGNSRCQRRALHRLPGASPSQVRPRKRSGLEVLENRHGAMHAGRAASRTTSSWS